MLVKDEAGHVHAGERMPVALSGRLTSTDVADYDRFIDTQASEPADDEEPKVSSLLQVMLLHHGMSDLQDSQACLIL